MEITPSNIQRHQNSVSRCYNSEFEEVGHTAIPIQASREDEHWCKRYNEYLWLEWEGIAQSYIRVFDCTKTFIKTVHELSRLPSGFEPAAMMLVKFSSSVLRAPKSNFCSMLNGQRCNIYGLLDTALFQILVNEWEEQEALPSSSWDVVTKDLTLELTNKVLLFPNWCREDFKMWDSDGMWMSEIYFKRSREYLEESLMVWKINAVTAGKLPAELLDEVVQYIELPTESLRERYGSTGKRSV